MQDRENVRKLLAILLLLVAGLPGAAPLLALAPGLFGAEPDAHLPACCRRDGKHHCAMAGMAATEQQRGGVSDRLQEHCPYAPVSAGSPASPSAAGLCPVGQGVALPLPCGRVARWAGRADALRRSGKARSRGPPVRGLAS